MIKNKHLVSHDIPLSEDEIVSEKWKTIDGYNNAYEVSNMGRVRSLAKTGQPRNKTLSSEYRYKTNTITPAGYQVVSLSENGKSRVKSVHHLVLDAFVGTRSDGLQTRHMDANRQNNRVTNLVWGTPQENSNDRMSSDGDQKLTMEWVDVVSSRNDGEEMTYDMEVDGPYHNFIAGGVVVHNSINEMSARYSILDNEMYSPHYTKTTPQSSDNKQGRTDNLLDPDDYNAVRTAFDHIQETSYQTYLYLAGPDKNGVQPAAPDVIEERRKTIEAAAMAAIQQSRKDQLDKIDEEQYIIGETEVETIIRDWFIQSGTHVITNQYPGIARELARMVLPVATYSQMYWKVNLHNAFHFLRLRCDPHAQYEIRIYAEKILELITPLFPMSVKAFEDYQMNATSLSAMETRLLKAVRAGSIDLGDDDAVRSYLKAQECSEREITEFLQRY